MMLLPLTNPLLSNVVLGIISPHGMTDYIHAKKFGLQKELYQVNMFTTGATLLTEYLHHEDIIMGAFLLASVVHFRNDMPYIKLQNIHPKVLQLFFSFCLIGSFYFIPIPLFVAYMVFIHTPNHYKMSWEYTKDYLQETVLLVSGVGITLLQLNILSQLIPLFSDFSLDLNLVEGLVISHIIYQEVHVFPEWKQLTQN